jgi:heme-degrading monooxygenase HmoA
MSVVMTLRVEGDGAAAEQLAAEQPSIFSDAISGAKERGLISHHFYASDREILVVDEWPSQEAFQDFFHDAGPQIQQIMSRAGVTTEPVITFWRKLETNDDVG